MIKEHPYYPQTIVFSENVQDAIDAARVMLDEQECQTVKQMMSINYDKLFKDPEFTRTEESIIKKGDLPESKMLFFAEKMKKIKWFRPQEIAPDFHLMGFLKSVALDNLGSLDEAIDMTNEKLTDGLRIF